MHPGYTLGARNPDENDAPPITLSVPRDSDARVQRMSVQVLSGPAAGQVLAARSDRAVIGKHPSADLVLSDPTVSRFHCELALEDSRVLVRDLGSRNGTFVDGVSVVIARLRNGSVLSLGDSRLRFDLGTESVEVPLAAGSRFGGLVGVSLAMRRAFALLERAAESDATVLLAGETGTGKEEAAEAVHAASARRDGPLVVVDCGAIPGELLESELFGHERGAFTGAVAERAGAFRAAHGGTIFLDEIGELPLDLQPKLLRALQKREVKRVGADHYLPVDVRVIAATNRDLRERVNAGELRADLFYRLAVVEIRLPPLRDRPEDLPLLVEHLAAELTTSAAERARLVEPAFVAAAARHDWAGNVRELRNYLERCLALREHAPPADPAVVPAGMGAPSVDPRQPFRAARDQWTRAFERRYLEGLLALHDGNVRKAAREAGIDRIYLYRLLARHGLR